MKEEKFVYNAATAACTYPIVAVSMLEAVSIAYKHIQKEIISINKVSNVPVLINSIKYDND